MDWRETLVPERVTDWFRSDTDGRSTDTVSDDSDPSFMTDRRTFIRASAGASILGLAGGLHLSEELYSRYKRFYEPVLDDAQDLLDGATTTDWAYQDGRAVSKLEDMVSDAIANRLPLIDGGSPRTFQDFCRDEYLVSSPEDDMFGLFNDDGQLTGFHDGESHNIPFSGPIGDPESQKYLPEGGFGGIRQGEDVRWLGKDFELVATDIEEQGVYRHRFRDPATGDEIEREAYVPFGSEQLRLDYSFDEEIDGDFIYYMMGNANDSYQNSIVFDSDPNTVRATMTEDGAVAQYASLVSDATMEIFLEDADRTRIKRAPITASDRRDAMDRTRFDPLRSAYENVLSPLSMLGDVAGEPLDILADWLLADLVEADEIEDRTAGGDLDTLLEADSSEARGRYVGIIHETDAADDATVTITGQDGHVSPQASGEATATAWSNWRDELATDELREQDRRLVEDIAATAVKTHIGDGRWLAAPQMQPNYNRIWPRDACYAAEFAAEAGMDEIAASTVAYLGSLLTEADEGAYLEQCYSPDGTYAGVVGVEMDQMAIFVETAYRVDDAIGRELLDDPELQEAVDAAAAYLADSFDENGLIEASHDYKEQPMDVTQSVWTNASAVNAFEYVTADQRIDSDYSTEAHRLQEAMENVLEDGPRWARNVTWDGERTYDKNGMATERVAELDGFGDLDAIIEETDFYSTVSSWIPAEAERAKGFYSAGLTEYGDAMLDGLRAMEEHGAMPERVTSSGGHSDARHLSWAQANTGLAVYRRAAT